MGMIPSTNWWGVRALPTNLDSWWIVAICTDTGTPHLRWVAFIAL